MNTKIGFVLCERMLSSGLSLPIEMWKAAASSYLAEQRTPTGNVEKCTFRQCRPESILTVKTIACNKNPIPTHSSFSITADATLEEESDYDVIYLPALWRNPRAVIRKHHDLLEWLTEKAVSGARIAAVGTGCCFLAEAGLLNGKPATTHWHYFKQFAHDYPDVNLQAKYFITQSQNIFCAASVKALSDLTIHFIETIYGKSVATHTQRTFFHEIRSHFERQCYQEENTPHPDEDIVQIQTWIKENYTADISMQALADMAGMSLRNFSRRFKNATDMSPLQYLLTVRVEAAITMLQTTNLSIQEIAILSGYQDISHFNRQFKLKTTISPGDYRKTVRAKLFCA
ncbi:AraC family transcriptional regulator with amidase-like domain [Enterobacillus tribolii]|uniref:AraC family transcriptional regulator with amidase-like domain n=2 Tax=Enterobacillus tribolii TaxID=1487935 RepID=A0A370R4U3_9GAMM|nr:AraC family transcriptional regulator with amidase-like domain [Enterobacillus tribolii]